MRKAFDEYQLLHNGGHRGSLWLGTDHLLIIEPVHFLVSLKETYRRLDYDSIQGIFVAKSKQGGVTTAVLSCLIALYLLFAGLMWRSTAPGFTVFWLGMALVFGILLAAHLWPGPHAGIIVQTAVKPWKLACVQRMRQAEKVMEALAGRCAEAQGGLLDPQAELPSATYPAPRPTGLLQPDAAATSPPPMPGNGPEANAETPHPNIPLGYLVLALFGGLLCGELKIDSIPYSLVLIIAGIIAIILLAAGAARRDGLRRTGLPAVWFLSIALLVVTGISAYVLAIAGVIAGRIGGSVNGQLEMVKILAKFPQGSPAAAVTYTMILGAGSVACAAIGLLACQIRYKRFAKQPAVPGL